MGRAGGGVDGDLPVTVWMELTP